MDEVVISSVKIGYRPIDTAQTYDNEGGVGAGIKACGILKKEPFVISKVAVEAKTYASLSKNLVEFRRRIGEIK